MSPLPLYDPHPEYINILKLGEGNTGDMIVRTSNGFAYQQPPSGGGGEPVGNFDGAEPGTNYGGISLVDGGGV